jgi:hypothetical protein
LSGAAACWLLAAVGVVAGAGAGAGVSGVCCASILAAIIIVHPARTHPASAYPPSTLHVLRLISGFANSRLRSEMLAGGKIDRRIY